MECKYCHHILDAGDCVIDFGKIPMTPNALERGVLLNNGSFYEYEFKIIACNICGLIQQCNTPNQDILYFRFKNEVIGEKWKRHFQEFARFILKNYSKNFNILEIGAGDLSLANMLVDNGVSNVTAVEKNIDTKNTSSEIMLHIGYLEEINFTKKFDIIYSSHVFEHIIDVQKHLEKISQILNQDGKFIFSLPNFRAWIENFNLNAFSQEHIVYPLKENIKMVLSKYGFQIKQIFEFEDHSLFIESQLSNSTSELTSNYNITKKLLDSFKEKIEKFAQFLNKDFITKDVYIFGANSSSQILLKKFLTNKTVICILDNAKIKENKFLYGFDYIVKKPDILKSVNKECTVLVFTGSYVEEIKNQIISINDRIKIITMNDFKNCL